MTSPPPSLTQAAGPDLSVLLARLATHIERATPGDGVFATAIGRLALIRASQPNQPVHALHQPALCVVARGAKRVMLQDQVYLYDPSRYLVASVDLLVSGQVLQATPEAPYLCVRLELDPGEIAGLMLQTQAPAAPALAGRGLWLSRTTEPLLDAVLRLVGLLETPEDIETLAPLAIREIVYRLLKSPEGPLLAHIARADGHGQRIRNAIAWIKTHLEQPLRIETLARAVHMSPSSLHQHFKAVTAMSPLQYQKQLRLQEARRLLLSEVADAASAGHRVGYASPSQFSREYRRQFGAPPARDIERLRAGTASDLL
ncbi:AraC family transcriptional regulator [Aquabacterium sp. A7-Y]|uniref:AraC family transcriptional regulator n=1 Tax=Aquabacterium sp. A7-Y TaxID=1349605 RepID=UPI00223D1058|nr:AraC family transcriptional regulator [Aquabacterium sp. A7-Y]MCW7537943.1 AraC family transcriptional regulator [Aquabacterium sp. A7-Y]